MPDELSAAILRQLAAVPADEVMSLPRLGKRLGLGASLLMRQLSLMGPATIGGMPGPGWVRMDRIDERWVAALTEAGRRHCAAHLGPHLGPHLDP